MKKVLITGSNGFLGQKLVKILIAKTEFDLLGVSRGENRLSYLPNSNYQSLDILDFEKVNELVSNYLPDYIINTAALTNVDQCKEEKQECWELNVDVVENLTKICAEINSHLIHLSTDFVFDGENGPYKEDDKPNPLSYYAKSKLASEEVLLKSNINWTIIRTILVYGLTENNSRSNVVTWVKESLEQGKDINVVTDHIRMPTLVEDLAQACILAIKNDAKGIYHISGKDMLSVYEMALKVADVFDLNASKISPTVSKQFTDADPRPPKTGFILDKARKDLGYQPHSFEDGLELIKKQYELITPNS
ncbi:MAG: SDR family oxidoreductase [Bacteroidia bacterium]|nr:SDR family oxidoreductase [Bacteroidia bacterium]MBL4715240.1 SDR family oxidoreductase [Bacteroidia bacterium]